MPGEEKRRVCIIGAGPSGMAMLYNLEQMKRDNIFNIPEFVCYEEQNDWGGLWNFSWRTGLDEHGEPCPYAMYHHLWTNSPKEAIEFPDYTFDEHFGRAIPAYPPRVVIRDYLQGRWRKDGRDLRQYIRFKTVVRDVQYNTQTDDFSVKAKNLIDDREEPPERFTHVIVAVGAFHTPNVPHFDGMDTFRGRILHARDFRNAEEFSGKRVLVVGSSFSAEDIAITCNKFGAKRVICTWRTKPMGFKWPTGIEERPLLQTIHDKTVVFKDKTTVEVDVIILCTGYILHFPFLPTDMRPKSEKIMSLYPLNLYKGIVWIKGGNRRLLYIGTYGQIFSQRLFDAQAHWACKFIMNAIPENETSTEEMENDAQTWRNRVLKIKNVHDVVDFQCDYLSDLTLNTGHCEGVVKAKTVFHMCFNCKAGNILTYRDKRFTSLYTGTLSTPPRKPFMEEFDDSFETFVT